MVRVLDIQPWCYVQCPTFNTPSWVPSLLLQTQLITFLCLTCYLLIASIFFMLIQLISLLILLLILCQVDLA